MRKKQQDELHLLRLNVKDETSKLTKVILGIATDLGSARGINPKAAAAIRDNIYPSEQKLVSQLLELERILVSNNVSILKPKNIKNVNQIFVRDLGFVVDNFFIVCNLFEEVRMPEMNGISHILSMIDPDKLVYSPKEVAIEGGDVVQYGDIVFVGLSRRTNREAVYFLQDLLPDKIIVPLELKSNTNKSPTNILHLDCAFQPIGEQSAVLYQNGFKSIPTDILDIFAERIIYITAEEMYQMVPNILSIDKNRLISCSSFTRVNNFFLEQGIDVLIVPFEAVGILGGLLRCSTLPLERF
ncbi:MAG: hypothetical protein KME38_28415 [Spirirestis rafaelensis WJT71-NPBG6]|jgi:N-dimethylarginine dimethylaminohydrolase|nr:hypothetical protein [Spirirestis rafaelensis WJT71-NPBG6]